MRSTLIPVARNFQPSRDPASEVVDLRLEPHATFTLPVESEMGSSVRLVYTKLDQPRNGQTPTALVEINVTPSAIIALPGPVAVACRDKTAGVDPP